MEHNLRALSAQLTRNGEAAGTEMLHDVSDVTRALLRGKRDAYYHAAEMVSAMAPTWNRDDDPASRTTETYQPAPTGHVNLVDRDAIAEVDAELSGPAPTEPWVVGTVDPTVLTWAQRDTWSDAMNEDDDERSERERWTTWAHDAQHPKGDAR